MKNLLLLHGALGSKEQFKSLEQVLMNEYKVHKLSFAGHGGETFPESELSIPFFAEQVIDYLDSCEIDKIDIFGYSMGGYVALYLAIHHPNRIGNIFTFATKFDWTLESAQKESSMLNPEVIEVKVPAYAEQLKSVHGENNWKILLNRTANMMISMAKFNYLPSENLTKIENKVMIGIGDKDKMVRLEETIAIYRALPNSSLMVLPNTAHPFDRINLEILSREILSFFS